MIAAIRKNNRTHVRRLLGEGFKVNRILIPIGNHFPGRYFGDGIKTKVGLGFSALHFAVWWKRTTIIELLLKSGADVNQPVQFELKQPIKRGSSDRIGFMGYSPLHLAIEKADLNIIKILVGDGANVNQQITKQLLNRKSKSPIMIWNLLITPLHLASKHNSLPIIKFLLSKGANINAQAIASITPLITASKLKIIRFLIDHGANPYVLTSSTVSVFDYCADSKQGLILFEYIVRNTKHWLKLTESYGQKYLSWPKFIIDMRQRILKELKKKRK